MLDKIAALFDFRGSVEYLPDLFYGAVVSVELTFCVMTARKGQRKDEQKLPEVDRRSDAPAKAIALASDGLQGVEEGWYSCRIPRSTLKALMRRSDAAGLANFGPWVLLLAASGGLAFLSWGSWWSVPAFLLYGTLYTSSDAHWHECAHGPRASAAPTIQARRAKRP